MLRHSSLIVHFARFMDLARSCIKGLYVKPWISLNIWYIQGLHKRLYYLMSLYMPNILGLMYQSLQVKPYSKVLHSRVSKALPVE